MSVFGDNLRTARLAKGLSQEALADRVGVSRASINRWENGGVFSEPPETLVVLAEYLGTTADGLVGMAPLFLRGDPVYDRAMREASRRVRELAEALRPPEPELDANLVESGEDLREGVGFSGVEENEKRVHRSPKVRGRGKDDALPKE